MNTTSHMVVFHHAISPPFLSKMQLHSKREYSTVPTSFCPSLCTPRVSHHSPLRRHTTAQPHCMAAELNSSPSLLTWLLDSAREKESQVLVLTYTALTLTVSLKQRITA